MLFNDRFEQISPEVGSELRFSSPVGRIKMSLLAGVTHRFST